MLIILLFLLLSTPLFTTAHRRILHQPFFPQSSTPPSPPPTSTPPPLPFSTTPTPTTTTTNSPPFFPSYPSPPPPPSPSTFASFPANISSITLPNTSKPTKPPSHKLILIAAASVLSALAILSLAIFLHLRTKHSNTPPHPHPPPSISSKSHRSDNNNNNNHNYISQNPNIPKLNRPSQTSSEFLYLGTLVSSHQPNNITNYNNRNVIPPADVTPRKLDSPELRPLPPLSGQQPVQTATQNLYFNNSNRSVGGDVASSKDEEEEFYSPKASSIGTGTIGSVSRRQQFTYVAVQHERSSSNSSTSSYSSSVTGSGPGSPVRSVSLSPGNTASPVNGTMMMIPKSPDLIEIQTFRPLGFQMPVLESDSASVSPRSSSSIGKGSRSSLVSSPRFSTNGDSSSPVRVESPVFEKASFVPMPPPPPPPPLPQVKRTVSEPPPVLLVSPLKTISVGNETKVSTIESSKSLDSGVLKEEELSEETTPKPKLKPLHWDKVRASSDREMVWDQLKCSSFKLNEEMIETLFVVNAPKPSPKEVPRWQVLPSPGGDGGNRVLDPKKAQNISILLRALNVTVEEVCEGLLEGNADTLGTELLESLLKMAPSKEEERKLKDYKDDSPFKLGAAEKFLKAVLDIPNAFKRVEAMLYVSNFDSEVEYLKKSFETLETACEELRTSRMFLKLLEAVLKTGNRMNVGTNRGDAHAFKLDTLLKLVDVKGTDGKTTLLHFVVQEIIRTEGARLSSGAQLENPPVNDDVKCRKLGLQVVSALGSSLSNVKKAAVMDAEVLISDVSKLSKGIMNIGEVARLNESTSLLESGSGNFSESMKCFMKKAEEEIIRIQAQESVALSLVKEITEYFHGNSAKEEAHPFRIFLVVRDFLTVLDRVCKEVGMINERTIVSSAHKFPVPINPMLQSGMGGFPTQRLRSSSDEESSSP